MNKLITTAKEYAIKCHKDTNHIYDKWPYEYHLRRVYDYAIKYIHLIPEKDKDLVLASCWTHDLIEDCRQTYNDIKEKCGEKIADITYALTNEKGKTRYERANEKYYEGIRSTPRAVFVKICDRLSNVSYSKLNNSSMLKVYKKQHNHFTRELYCEYFDDMFKELEELLK
jgi:(p)ppGpp synthase/HD superfamily hydrolase